MTELENENFRKFMEENLAETLPVWKIKIALHLVNQLLPLEWQDILP